ncbi:P-selectin-like isoform X4 [Alosa pseudoharengus]|uniref:P-selectin-like isoform X4 n=1 Tax=Alosa pseudoharengus TaxID=34774 RepID=UPI003F8BE130
MGLLNAQSTKTYVCEKMRSWIFHQHSSMVTVALGITFIAISNDLLPSRMGVQAWTYNYTTDPLDWDSARLYCKKHFTDMVAIQNKDEIAYLNKTLPKPDKGYYWIGIRKRQEKWTWVGTNKVLTPEAENWAMGEPNDLGDGQDCVEIYIKRHKDTAKWNDENCKNKKGTICYTASCSKKSCQNGTCVETIGDFKCRCYLGFEGPRCERAVECPEVSDVPSGGSMNCSHPIPPHRCNSTCEFRCDKGFLLQGAQRTECDATGQWTHPAPNCTVVTCDPLLVPSGVHFTCENPLGASSYNSTCNFSCKAGHTLTGPANLTCLASGAWSAAAPVCEVVRCGQLNAPLNGKLRCQDPLEKFSYNSTCWSECDSGFILKGSSSTHCSARGQWSHALPVCQAVECPGVSDAPGGGRMNCSHPISLNSFNSTCEFRCDEGFLLQGAQRTECDATGQWTHPAPNCTVVTCDPLLVPSGVHFTCENPLGASSYNSTCNFSCKAGHTLTGPANLTCLASGAWSAAAPVCEVVRCGQLNDPLNGKLRCQDPLEKFSYNSTCWSECDSGFILKGSSSTHCSARGQWSHALPICQAVECPAVTDAPSGGSMNCSHPISPNSFNSTCEFRCDEGFLLQGAQRTECDATGQWTHPSPNCTAVRCEHLKAPSNGTLRCQDPLEKFSYNSTCWSECDSGFILKGSSSTHCSARGRWSHALPICQVVTCDPLLVPSGVHFTCENPLGASSYNSTCNFSCKAGHTLTGPANLTCLASGAWSAAAPVCEVVGCGQLNDPLNGKLRCQDPLEKFSYNSTCWSECDSGFILKGSSSTHCSARGRWSHALPICQAVECPAVTDAPSGGSMNCSHPISPNSFNSTCEFRCDEGFLLQGAQRTECDATGQWTHPSPNCTAVRCEHLKAPSNGTLRCQDPLEKFSYNSTCWSECDSGFILKGSSSTHCSARGRWSHALPICQVVTCDPLLVPSGVHFTCENPLGASSYNSTCNFSCKAGHTLTGPANLTCLASGAWSAAAPVCEVVRCGQLNDPLNGKLRCQDPLEKFSYNSTCWSECDSGFILKGSSSTHCSARGRWSHALPICQAVECPAVSDAPGGRSMNCSHPISANSFNSTCEFRCDEGFLLQGAQSTECDATGLWTHPAPNCTVIERPLSAALLMYTAVGIASVLGLFGLIGVGLFVRHLTKKASSSMDETLWNTGINPVFDVNI